MPAADDRVTVTVYPGGPALIRGPVEIVGEDGEVLPRRRSTVALCRCGLSGRPPWCDSSHKLGRRAPERTGRSVT
jgi:CDGSH-type Zn-finger protein